MKNIYFYTCLIFLLIATSISAVDYKEYKTSQRYKEYFEVTFDRNSDTFGFRGMNTEPGIIRVITGTEKELKFDSEIIYLKGKKLIDSKSIYIEGNAFPIHNITGCEISESNNFIYVTFLTAQDSSKLARFKRGNRTSNKENITIKQSDFVRGIIFSVSGNITIEGEVNKDVVSLFGDINIIGSGVVRGNLASITGEVNIDKDALVYGEIYDHKNRGRGLKHRLYRDKREFDYDPYFSYDRVDGASISLKGYHNDIDSILPTLEAEIGIGFASDRGRYKFLIEQTLFREKAIAIGGTFYRELASDDNWLIGKSENTFFALLAKEDYKDYYEAEGGSIYLKALPTKNITIKTGYSFYASKWLPSNRHLWALFRGKDKLFDLNYHSWDESIRADAIAEIDTSEIGSLFASIHYYSDSMKSETENSNWHIFADFEFSQTGLNSDFDYHRYMITARRLQKINEQSSFTIRTVFGNSNGYLPMFKKFHLGGLSTLHGYAHKEYIGNRFWMTNSEYRIDFPGSEFGVSLFWDVGQIANERKLNSDIDIKQSIGLSLFFEEDFTLSVAKRLDRSTNDSPKLYIRFNTTF